LKYPNNPQSKNEKAGAPVAGACKRCEIRRASIQSQPGQIVHETPSRKTLHKKWLEEWLKVQALSSNPSTTKKKKKKKDVLISNTKMQVRYLLIPSEVKSAH
jgi:hypothetical protein